MASLADVFRVLQTMRAARVFTKVDRDRLRTLLSTYGISARIPDDV